MTDAAPQQSLILVPIGVNRTLIWGMTSLERLRRIAMAQDLVMAEDAGAPCLRVDLGYVFDPEWLRWAAAHPGGAVTRGGVPVIAHAVPGGAPLIEVAQETTEIENVALRKRERPFMERLMPESVPAIERAAPTFTSRRSTPYTADRGICARTPIS